MNISFIILIVFLAYLPNIIALFQALHNCKKDFNVIFTISLLIPCSWYVLLFIAAGVNYQEKRRKRIWPKKLM